MIFRRSFKKNLIISIALLAIFIFLFVAGGLNLSKKFSFRLFGYFQTYTAKTAFFLNKIVFYVKEPRNLSEVNQQLFDENNILKARIIQLKEVEQENKMFRSILNLPTLLEHNIIDATVIGKDPYFFSNVFIIDRGHNFEIDVGMNVIDSKGYFIGKIAETNESISKIRTIFDNMSFISALDQETRVQGIIKYDLSDGLIFDMVPQDEKVESGDTIIAFLVENRSTLPIAKVLSIEKIPNKQFQKIKIYPLADFKKMERVFVIIK